MFKLRNDRCPVFIYRSNQSLGVYKVVRRRPFSPLRKQQILKKKLPLLQTNIQQFHRQIQPTSSYTRLKYQERFQSQKVTKQKIIVSEKLQQAKNALEKFQEDHQLFKKAQKKLDQSQVQRIDSKNNPKRIIQYQKEQELLKQRKIISQDSRIRSEKRMDELGLRLHKGIRQQAKDKPQHEIKIELPSIIDKLKNSFNTKPRKLNIKSIDNFCDTTISSIQSLQKQITLNQHEFRQKFHNVRSLTTVIKKQDNMWISSPDFKKEALEGLTI